MAASSGKQKQIYFQPTDMDVYEHVQSQPNASQYLIRLARDDMKKPSGATWEAIKRILEKEKAPGQDIPKEL